MWRSNYYRGWTLSHCYERPVTGRWVAVQHGVEICHSDREGLCSMIDQRAKDAQILRDRRDPCDNPYWGYTSVGDD